MFLYWHESRKTKSWTKQLVWIHLTKVRAGDVWNQWVAWLFSTPRAIRFSNSVSFSNPSCFEPRERGGDLQWKSVQVTALRYKALLKAGTCPGVGVEMDDELNTATFWLWPLPGNCEEMIFFFLPDFLLEQAGRLAKALFDANPTVKQSS